MKVLASDFDRTLYFMKEKEEFKKEDVKRIKEFQAKGNLFGMCTGRPFGGFVKTLNGQVAPDFFIMSTGGLIVDKNGEVLWGQPLDYQIIKEIYSNDEEGMDVIPQSALKDYLYTTAYIDDNDRVKHIDSLDYFDDIPVYSASLINLTIEKVKYLTDYINEHYESVDAYQNVDSVDVVCHGVSKGHGILKLKEILKIDKIAGIGDSYNDVPMLDEVDTSFTFTYSPKEIQDSCNHVVNQLFEAIDILERED